MTVFLIIMSDEADMLISCSPSLTFHSCSSSVIVLSSSSPSTALSDILPSLAVSTSHNEVNYVDNRLTINPRQLESHVVSSSSFISIPVDSMTEEADFSQTLVILSHVHHEHPQIKPHQHHNQGLLVMNEEERIEEKDGQQKRISNQNNGQNNSQDSKDRSRDQQEKNHENKDHQMNKTSKVTSVQADPFSFTHFLEDKVLSSQVLSAGNETEAFSGVKTSTRMIVVTETKLTCYASLTMVTYSTPQEVVILTQQQTTVTTTTITKTVTVPAVESSLTASSPTVFSAPSTTSTSLVDEVTASSNILTFSHSSPESLESSSLSGSFDSSSSNTILTSVTPSFTLLSSSLDTSNASFSSSSSVTPIINLSLDPSLDHDDHDSEKDVPDHHLHTTLMPQTSFSLSSLSSSLSDSSHPSTDLSSLPSLSLTTATKPLSSSSSFETPSMTFTDGITPSIASSTTNKKTHETDDEGKVIVSKTMSSSSSQERDMTSSSKTSMTTPFTGFSENEEDEGRDDELEDPLLEFTEESGSPSPETTDTRKSTASSSKTFSIEDLITELKETLTPTHSDDFRSRTTILHQDSSSISSLSPFNTDSSLKTMTTSSSDQTINQRESKQRPTSSSTPSVKINASTPPGVIVSSNMSTVHIVSSSSSVPMNADAVNPSRVNTTASPVKTLMTAMTIDFPEEEEESVVTTKDTPPLEILPSFSSSSSFPSTQKSIAKTTGSAENFTNSFSNMLPETSVTLSSLPALTSRDGNTIIFDPMESSHPPTSSMPNESSTANNIHSSTFGSTEIIPISPLITNTSTSTELAKTQDEYGKKNNKEEKHPTFFASPSTSFSLSSHSIQPTLASNQSEDASLSSSKQDNVMFTLHPNLDVSEEDAEDFKSHDTPSLMTPTHPSLTVPSSFPGDSILQSSSKTLTSTTKEFSPTSSSSSPPVASPATPFVPSNHHNNKSDGNCSQSVPPSSSPEIPSKSTSLLPPVKSSPEVGGKNDNKRNNNINGTSFESPSFPSSFFPDHPLLSFKTSSGEVISLDWLPILLISIGFLLILLSWVFGFIVCRKNRRLRRELASSLTSELISTKIHMPPSSHGINSFNSSGGSSNWKMVSTPAMIHHQMLSHPLGTSSTSYTTTSSSMQSLSGEKESSKKMKRGRKNKDKSEFEYVSFVHPKGHEVNQSPAHSFGQFHTSFARTNTVTTSASIEVDDMSPSQEVNKSCERLLVIRPPVPKERTSLQVHRFGSTAKDIIMDGNEESGRMSHVKTAGEESRQVLESRRAVEDLQRFFEHQVQDESSGGKSKKSKHKKDSKKKSINKRSGQDEEVAEDGRMRRIQKSTLDIVKEKVVPISSSSHSLHALQEDIFPTRNQMYSPPETVSSYILRNMIDRDEDVTGHRHLTRDSDLLPYNFSDPTKAIVQDIRRELHKFDSVTYNVSPSDRQLRPQKDN